MDAAITAKLEIAIADMRVETKNEILDLQTRVNNLEKVIASDEKFAAVRSLPGVFRDGVQWS